MAQTVPKSYGPVAPGETLWAIAKRLKPWEQGAATEQMAWALYRANPQAFDGVPGKIRKGATLIVPDIGFVLSVPQAQAYQYVTGRAPPVPKMRAAASPRTNAEGQLSAFAPNPETAMRPGDSVAFAKSSEGLSLLARFKSGASAEELYRDLEPLEERYAGDVDYDYVYGSSAYDSGRYSEAIFILQRAVSLRPRFSGARMELARAYYAIGDNESARREFTTLQSQNPPAEALKAIAEYLRAIDRRAAVYEPQQGAYVELASGYDSNANGAPDTRSFLGIPLDSRNQTTESGYYSLGLGGELSRPFAPTWRALGDAQVLYRSYPDASFVDAQFARIAGGIEWRPSRLTLNLLPAYSYAMLDGAENHQNIALDVTGIYDLEVWRLSFSGRYGQTRYIDALAIQDVDAVLLGLAAQGSWLTLLARVQFSAALTVGQEQAVEDSSPYGRDLLGARLTATLDIGRGHAGFVSVGGIESDYDTSVTTFFGSARKDEQLSAALGYEWGAYRAAGWIVRAQIGYVNNSSDVALYDYDRLDAGFTLRKEFR